MHWKRLNREEVDTSRWEIYLEGTSHSQYMWPTFLDSLGKDFDVAVYGDYEAVFPLFFGKKWSFLSYAYQPILTQYFFVPSQLKDSLLAFLKGQFFHFNLNIKTEESGGSLTNMLLPAGDNGEPRKKLVATLKKLSETELTVEAVNALEAKVFLDENLFSRVTISVSERKILNSFYDAQLSEITHFGLTYQGELFGVATILKTQKRWVYLKGTVTKDERFPELGVYLLKHIIESRPEDVIFDFSGSMIPGVAAFFRKFKPQEEFYEKYTYFKFSFLNQTKST